MSSSMKSPEQTEREHARWTMLMALYHGGGQPVAERLLLSVLEAVPVKADAGVVRAHLRYLEDCGLARLHEAPDGRVTGAITHGGMDVIEYNADCPPGIARPRKYW